MVEESPEPSDTSQVVDRSLQDAWQILELAAIHHPDTLAVIDCGVEDRILTYGQLYSRSAALAAFLRNNGVRRGSRIGVLCRNSSHVMELHYAAAALHAVVVNLNIHLAAPELAYILQDSGPVLVFADRHLQQGIVGAHQELQIQGHAPTYSKLVWMDVDTHFPEIPVRIEGVQTLEYVDCVSTAIRPSDMAGICAEVLAQGSEDDGFHMYYTSGTTGHPKGVVLSHHIVVQHAVGTITEMNLNRHDVWAHFAPMFHLVDVFAVYAITLVGGRHITLPTFNATEALLAIGKSGKYILLYHSNALG